MRVTGTSRLQFYRERVDTEPVKKVPAEVVTVSNLYYGLQAATFEPARALGPPAGSIRNAF